jgi:hypothetical protein
MLPEADFRHCLKLSVADIVYPIRFFVDRFTARVGTFAQVTAYVPTERVAACDRENVVL